ncbi:histone-like nucleoid-structuring protein Lsr2 [Spongiactinospora sp. 9N601]|uniref:Lsr2 family DNA-binding protein n=1 Tax=Spongiactinospora sp. 9N601 TaxID=3375149 RepID=UPI0037B3B3E2
MPMTDEAETPAWERLRRLSQMSRLERRAQATRWADELMRRLGAEAMPSYVRVAHRDTIAAVLFSLVDEDQTPASGYLEREPPNQPYGTAEGIDAPNTTRSHGGTAAVIRAWAQQKGIQVSDRGRIPMWVIHRYHAEHAEQGSEVALAHKIYTALRQHGELTKSQLWEIIGHNHSASEIAKALERLPNVQLIDGESNGGRPPVIFRLVEAEPGESGGLASGAASGQLTLGDMGVEDFSPLPGNPSHAGMSDSKVHDFLQILRGEMLSD